MILTPNLEKQVAPKDNKKSMKNIEEDNSIFGANKKEIASNEVAKKLALKI